MYPFLRFVNFYTRNFYDRWIGDEEMMIERSLQYDSLAMPTDVEREKRWKKNAVKRVRNGLNNVINKW